MTRDEWNKEAANLLLGRKIVRVKYMSSEAAEEDYHWDDCPIMIGLDDGSWVVPQSDDEGNNAGAIGVATDGDEHYYILPVLDKKHE